ncbi:PQQ-binding-like beta-propeller repeat protein [Luteolibacter marinus]|uniref:outer membrane protein assembly factor BamB family protein n=1 Tax=Luteolibacter marinus TaxID=2776705 RepID=UPI001867B4F9|nr:PQQ-binding-like beta-propeller repeat protein [Luteolibacter marinus]
MPFLILRSARAAALALTIASTHVVQSEVTIFPELFPTSDLAIDTGFGITAELPFTLESRDGALDTDWQLLHENPGDPSLAGTLGRLNESVDALLELIPRRHLFSGGESGDVIRDYGGEMYQAGNNLALDDTYITYSDNTVRTISAGTGSATYFTRKFDGLFIFSAELRGISNFTVSGFLKSFRDGPVSTGEFTVDSEGTRYLAYVKQVHGNNIPTVNHLILLPDMPGISRSASDNPASDNHQIGGLPASTPIHQLVFSQPSGGYLDLSVFKAMAGRYLAMANEAPDWFVPPARGGRLAPYESIPFPCKLTPGNLLPGQYQTRFTAAPAGSTAAEVPPEAWRKVEMNVAAPDFAPERGIVDIGTLVSFSPGPIEVQLQPTGTSPLPDNLSVTSDAPWLSATHQAAGNGSILLETTSAELPAGTYLATVSVASPTTRREITVFLRVARLNITQLLADPVRPLIYGLVPNGIDNGGVAVIDTVSRGIIDYIPAGRNPTDLDLTEGAAELLVCNTIDASVSRIDLASRTVTATHPLPEFSHEVDYFGGRVADGPGNIIYYLDEQRGPRLRVFDTSTGTVIQTLSSLSGDSPDLSGFQGYGDIVVSPDGSKLFGWSKFLSPSGGGYGGTHVVRFDIAPDGTLGGFTRGADSNSVATPNFQGYPTETPAMMTADGTGLFIKDREVDQTDLDFHPLVFPAALYSISPGGELGASTTRLYQSADPGGPYIDLASYTWIQAFTPDYAWHVSFNRSTATLDWIDLRVTPGLDAIGIRVFPADGATVAQPSEVRWTPEIDVREYRVFLGTDAGAVSGATFESPEFIGVSNGARFALPEMLEPDGEYFWRIDHVRADGTVVTGTTRSFHISPIVPASSSVQGTTVAGNTRHLETILLESPQSSDWTATCGVPWISFAEDSGTTPAILTILVDASQLAPGKQEAVINIGSGGNAFELPLKIDVRRPTYIMAKPDPRLPLVYAVSEEYNSSQPSFLMVIDATTGTITGAVPVGREVSDIAVHPDENRIYVANWKAGILRAIDRSTLREIRTYGFEPVTDIYNAANDVRRIAAGRSGRLMIEENKIPGNLKLMDTVDGTIVASLETMSGGGTFDPAGRYYYHGDVNVGTAALHKIDTAGDSLVEVASFRVSGASNYGSVRVHSSPDGSRFYWNGGIFDPDLAPLHVLTEEVVAATSGGEVVCTNRSIYNGFNGQKLAASPMTTYFQVIAGDESTLLSFGGDSIARTDLATLAGLPDWNLTPSIANGATVVGTTQTLSWSLEPFAFAYDVYFGTDPEALAKAGPGDDCHLGQTGGTTWTGTLPSLDLDGDYYWRVDTQGFSGTKTGTVWSFNVAPIDVTPRAVMISAPNGTPIAPQSLGFAGPGAWSATTSTAWITLDTTSGTTATPLTFQINAAGLSNTTRIGSIRIESGTDSFLIPVTLDLFQINVTQLAPDPKRPVVYGINYRDPSQGSCHLLKLDGTNGDLLGVTRLGYKVNDIAIDPSTDRLYASNTGYPETRVIDLESFSELPPLSLGTGVFKLEVDPIRQRIITESERSPAEISIFDIGTGRKLGFINESPGGGVLDASGNYYYHTISGYNGKINKYDLSVTPPALVAASGSTYGTRLPLLTHDGRFIVQFDTVYDSVLNAGLTLPDDVWSLSPGSELAVGENMIWWLDSGTPVRALPFATTISSFTGDSRHLLLYNPASRSFASLPLDEITELPGPWPHDRQILAGSPAVLRWTAVPDAVSYSLVITDGHSGDQVYSGLTDPSFVLPDPLAFGETYTWRVTAQRASAPPLEGAALGFSIAFPQGPGVSGVSGQSVALGPRHLLLGSDGNVTMSAFDPQTGVSSPLENLTIPGNSTTHAFGVPATIDNATIHVGASQWDTSTLNNCGAAVLFKADALDRLRPRLFTAPSPVANQAFGGSIAAQGDLLLVGPITGNQSLRGKVSAYLTHPERVLLQEIQPADSTLNDRFGRSIALDGNVAVISSPGSGTSATQRLPVAYVFTRSTVTGQWTQRQKLALPGAVANNDVASSMALGDDLLAINNTSRDEVMVFTRRPDDTFIHHSTINRTGVPDATNRFGASVAIHGDLLMIGDTGALPDGTNSQGAVFTFHRSGNGWVDGPVITPQELRTAFGSSLAVRDGWLLAGGATSFSVTTPAWLFRIDPTGNFSPTLSDLPFQAAHDRPFRWELTAGDLNGSDGITLTALQLPAWLSFTDLGDGRGILSGIPTAAPGSNFDLQFKVTDPFGASAYRSSRLTLVAGNDRPTVTLTPSKLDLKEGAELTLMASASGTGPFSWQWLRDGNDLPGATSATFQLPEASVTDAGVYTAVATNAAGSTASTPVAVTVAPADRFAGPWSTFGSNTRRSGYHPARLGNHVFVPAWEAAVSGTYPLLRPVIADGKVFINHSLLNGGGIASIQALDLITGTPVWDTAFAGTARSNPLSWHGGRLYYQQTKSDESRLWSLDAANGETLWSSPFTSQSYYYEAPAATDDGVWMCAGYGSGIYGFDPDGTPRFQVSLPQYNQWTPAVSAGRLFSWVNGVLREHDPLEGAAMWSASSGWTWSSSNIPAFQGNSVVTVCREGICCFDLQTRAVRWRIEGIFSGSPAVAGDRAFVIRGQRVESFRLSDGQVQKVFEAGATITSGQPLLLQDHLAIATAGETFIFDRSTGDPVQSLPIGGLLSYADGHLLIAGPDGVLRAYFANAAPTFSPEIPTAINAGAAAADLLLDLTPFASDPDPADRPVWSIAQVSRPGIFRVLEIDPARGELSVVYNPWESGSSEVVIQITDNAGNTARSALIFTIPPHSEPTLRQAETLILNRQTGLFEHTITVTNTSAREIAGFDLFISGLPDGVQLVNASGSDAGTWTVEHRQPVAAGATVTLVLEYFSPVRGTIIEPRVELGQVAQPAPDPAPGESGLAVDRCALVAGGLLIEFSAIPGGTYEIQYCDNTVDWKSSPILIHAAGNRVQWIDRGPPRTDAPPADKTSRFYRVLEIIAEE